jgi:flavin-dependent dehydrogenase
LFLVGDVARVVEPFTGEGIYYALRSGELAAEAIASGDADTAMRTYANAHEKLYRGRLWVNRIARAAVLSPRLTSTLMSAHLIPPRALRLLTSKVVS